MDPTSATPRGSAKKNILKNGNESSALQHRAFCSRFDTQQSQRIRRERQKRLDICNGDFPVLYVVSAMGPPAVRLYAVLRLWVAKAIAAPWTGRVAHHGAVAQGHRSSSALKRHFEAGFDSYMRLHEKAREPMSGSDCI